MNNGTNNRGGTVRRLAGLVFDRRRWVLFAWLAALVVLVVAGQAAGGETRTEFELPGSESQAAFDLLQDEGFATQAGLQGQIVFQAEQGVDDPQVRATLEDFLRRIQESVPDVSIVSPYEPGGERQISPSGNIAYAEVDFAERDQEAYQAAADTIRDLREEAQAVPGLRIELGGDVFASGELPQSEIFGVIAAAIILLIAFGSLLAMTLPLISALFGIGAALSLVTLGANFIDVPSFAAPAAAMIGIGVGIDYALFIVMRHRDSLREGVAPRASSLHAMNTAGRAIFFAGITVVISLMGMFFLNLDAIRSLALAATLAVLLTMLASLTLLPAMFGFLGRNIDRFGLPHRAESGSGGSSFWYRWSRVIQRYPLPALALGVTVLLVMAIPLFSMRLGFADAGNRPAGDTTRQAYDLLAEGFGPGYNGPLLIAAELPPGEEGSGVMEELAQRLRETEGVAQASPPVFNEDQSAAIIQVIPTTSPQAEETTELVDRLRDDVVPAVAADSQATVHVGGSAAASIDFSQYTADRLPYFIGVVLLLSFALLTMVFRSVVIPVKAVLMNLLSIGGAFGLIVAVFQWNWAGSLVGVGSGAPVEAWAPLIIFPVVFGLSMDYEVFLLSRIKENYDRTRDNAEAVADGLASTARVISAAALIMICVFLAFVLGDDRALKLMGFGLAVAVFLDATIVRLIIVPSAMELLGDRNWWMPSWLDRLLPRIQIEGQEQPERVYLETPTAATRRNV